MQLNECVCQSIGLSVCLSVRSMFFSNMISTVKDSLRKFKGGRRGQEGPRLANGGQEWLRVVQWGRVWSSGVKWGSIAVES